MCATGEIQKNPCVEGQTHICEVIISMNAECVEQLVGCSKGQASRVSARGFCHFKHPASQFAHGSVLRPRLPAVQLAYVSAR